MNVVYGEYIDSPGPIYAWELPKYLSPSPGDYLTAQTHGNPNKLSLILVTHEPEQVSTDYITDLGGVLPLPKILK